MGSGIVSTEIDGCLSSYTEVELEAKTQQSLCRSSTQYSAFCTYIPTS